MVDKILEYCFKRNNIFALVACVFLLFLVSVFASETEITILHTADLHGHMEASVVPDVSDEPRGGLLRCAALIEKNRKESKNVILLDCGDLFQGTAASYLGRGEIMAKSVKYLRYDALVTGNHEFDWGVAGLREFYGRAGIPVLSAGISKPKDFCLPLSRPFLVRQFGDVRVAVVGLVNPMVPGWSRPRLLDDLSFLDSLEALRAVMPEVRKTRPDILILVAHQGWRQWGDDRANEINKIAKAFPDFNLIIGAHTHAAIPSGEVNGIVYTQAGYYGLWLGKVVLRYDGDRRMVTKIEPRLLDIGADVVPEQGLQKLVAPDLLKAESYLAEKIGVNANELRPESEMPGQSGVQTLIAASMAATVNAEVVFHGTLSSANLPRGMMRMENVWRIVPYENTIARAWLTIDEIREILEENSRYYGRSQFRGVYGMTYELTPKAPVGKRVANIRLNSGRKIKNGQRIAIAVNSYDLASAGDRLPRLREIMERPESKLEETDKDTRDAVIKYIRGHSPLEIQAAAGAIIR